MPIAICTSVSRMQPKMSSSVAGISLYPLVPLTFPAKHTLPSKYNPKKHTSIPKICCSQNTTPQQQLNLSVLRFTLGIPGLDETYLPRYIGYAFGALLMLNHFVGSDSSSITPAQLRTEALELSLAAFSAVVPFLGKFLKGATPTQQKSIPEDAEQIFVMTEDISGNVKEDLAWGTYVLLRNTNSISVLISVDEALCVRGYWNTPKDLPKEKNADWFRKQIQRIEFSNLKDTVYFQQDSEWKEMVPAGTRSLLVQPIILDAPSLRDKKGFVLLASSIDYAFSDKDRAWIAAIANKFTGGDLP